LLEQAPPAVSDHLKTYFSEPLPAVSESRFVASF
jgi:hypothetical protein